jgi:hypothetical protein
VGSGTTIIAAEMTGRKCLAIEINPAYVDVCIERWQNFTEQQATLDNKTFAEVRNARLAGLAQEEPNAVLDLGGGQSPSRLPTGVRHDLDGLRLSTAMIDPSLVNTSRIQGGRWYMAALDLGDDDYDVPQGCIRQSRGQAAWCT